MWRFDDDESDEEEETKTSNESDPQFRRMDEKFLKSRTIIVAETVTDKLYRKVAMQLTVLEQDDAKAPIHVYVNSPGGSADSGFAIYDLFKFSTVPVVTIANGLVASSAVLIYLGGDDGKRFSLANARFLLHQPSTGARGQASDIDITAKEILRIRERYNRIVERHTGKPMAKLEHDAKRDFWLSADEATQYGLVNRIASSRADLG